MWDAAGLPLKLGAVPTTPYACPMFAPALPGFPTTQQLATGTAAVIRPNRFKGCSDAHTTRVIWLQRVDAVLAFKSRRNANSTSDITQDRALHQRAAFSPSLAELLPDLAPHEKDAGRTAHWRVLAGERQLSCLAVYSKRSDAVTALVAGIQKRSAGIELDVPWVISHG